MAKKNKKRSIYTQIEVRCAVVLLKDNKVLLVKHKHKGEEYWVLPGGKLKYGETLEECCKRELKEELNINIKIEKIFTTYDFITKNRHRVDIFFIGKILDIKNLKLRKSSVLKDYKFYNIKNLTEIDFRPKNLIKIIHKDFTPTFRNKTNR